MTEQAQDNQPVANPLLEQLRRDLQTPGAWARRFRTLVEDAMNTGKMDTTLTCQDVQNVLDVYLNAELKGDDVRLAYPEVWQHIQTCAGCRQEHDAVLDVLSEHDEEAHLNFTPTPRPLPFLQAKSDHAGWVSRVRSRLAGASFGIHILLDPDYLRGKLGFASPLQTENVYRSDTLALSSEPRVLLIDNVSLDGQPLNVEIAVVQAASQPDKLALQATLTGSAPLPDNLWIRLTWAGHTYAAPVIRVQPDEGQALVEGISLERVRDALGAQEARFEIILETRDTPDDDDDTSSPD
jgi:hypothetical protein